MHVAYGTAALLLAVGCLSQAVAGVHAKASSLPIVINTWAFTNATEAAWAAVNSRKSSTPALDAVEQGCSSCERDRCDRTVGPGGSPDENGETTLDAMIMDGNTMEVGAVSSLRHVGHAVSTARLVMERTRHSMLAGLQAAQFAQEMGVPVQDLSSAESLAMHKKWLKNDCQPNFRRHVVPDPTKYCGPYRLDHSIAVGSKEDDQLWQPFSSVDGSTSNDSSSSSDGPREGSEQGWASQAAHDTIAMAAIDADGNIAAGCSTNGAIYKVPGRVGDGSIPGGGAYADSEVGACGATGDGDVHLRFLPCYQVVESLRQGMKPKAAAEDAVRRIAKRVPGYVGAVIALDRDGNHAAACHGWTFRYAYRDADSDGVQVVTVDPIPTPAREAHRMPQKQQGGDVRATPAEGAGSE